MTAGAVERLGIRVGKIAGNACRIPCNVPLAAISTDPLGRRTIDELQAKLPRVVPGRDWRVHQVFFARAGFTSGARRAAAVVEAELVDLERLEEDLAKGDAR